VLQRLAGRIGVSVSKRALGKGISRWLPIVGALGVGAYAYYDTGQVAKTAIDLFSGEVHVEGGDDPDSAKPGRKASPTGSAAPRKRATAKNSVARKAATAKVVKSATKKATKKTAARRAPAKKATRRKNTPAR
jgi:hypothetical protein